MHNPHMTDILVGLCGQTELNYLQKDEYMFICQKQPMTDILFGLVPQTDTY